jgi:DNA invertase Pin-like site-specific DNA recombinase
MSNNIKKSAGALNSAQVSEMQFALMEAIARQRSQSISDNVKRSIQSKLKNGEWIGKMPFGYKTVYSSIGQKSQVLDPNNSAIVTYMFETYTKGTESIASLSKKFGLSRSVILNILQNSFYVGQMFVKSQNKYYSHNYPILIEKELFDQCQQKMQKR